MTAIRAGLLGLGAMGRHHARVLREIEGVDLVAVADPQGDSHGVAHGLPVLHSVEQLLDAGVDCAVLAIPISLHVPTALALVSAGVHILVEKPVSADAASARALADAVEAAGVVGAVGHIERFNPAVQQLRERLADGAIGDIHQVATRRQGPFPARVADVGVVADLASHDIDIVSWVTGSAYASLTAQTAHRSGRQFEDLVAVTARLGSGVVVNHLVNWLSPMKERVVAVTGERGSLVADTLSGDLVLFRNGSIPLEWDAVSAFRGVTEGDVIRFAFPKREPLRSELEAFRDAILGEPSTVVTVREGADIVTVVEAILDAAARNEVVRL